MDIAKILEVDTGRFQIQMSVSINILSSIVYHLTL